MNSNKNIFTFLDTDGMKTFYCIIKVGVWYGLL